MQGFVWKLMLPCPISMDLILTVHYHLSLLQSRLNMNGNLLDVQSAAYLVIHVLLFLHRLLLLILLLLSLSKTKVKQLLLIHCH